MLRSETLFGKRDNAASVPSSTPLAAASNGTLVTSTPLSANAAPASASASAASAVSAPVPAAAIATQTVSGGGSLMRGTQGGGSFLPAGASNEGGSRLIVGPNIKLKGVEITDCDTLVVEGKVEATIDSRVIQIASVGSFKGSAEIDIAEIHGEFDGDLTVRQKLVIYASGKVTGKVRYGKVVIEEGGQLAGDIQVGTATSARGIGMAKAG